LVEVICDTSFLIHLSTRKIKNIDSVNTEIGQIQFVVPSVVIIATIDNELKNKIKKLGGSVMSFSNDKIVLES
jgi:hypothetical protein